MAILLFSPYKAKTNPTSYRFPVAIKSPKKVDSQSVKLFLDEAKTMVQIGEYHNNIVNLQGIIWDEIVKNNKFPEVRI